jgi:hypothetical protein
MEPNTTLSAPWSAGQKWAFRFAFLFFVLFIFFEPNAGAPLLSIFYGFYIQPMHWAMAWLGAHVLHLPQPVTTFTNGSGDTTYDYLVVLTVTVSSAIGTVIWSLAQRGPCNYEKLYYWLTVVVRFYVGITMMAYGAVKVIKLQFPSPGLGRLLEAYGDSSPMGLAWTFMGYSKGYNYFTGLAELSCGILLLFRRTTMLGAVIALTVSANIMAINYCFDVPVKIVSTALVLMTLFLLSRNLHRFMNFFILNKLVEPEVFKPMRFKKRWKNITLITFKYLLIAGVAITTAISCIESITIYGDDAPKPPLYGIYNAETFIRGRDSIAPLTTDTTRWRRLVISGQDNARVYFMNDSTRNYAFKADTVAKKITLYTYADTLHKYKLNYTQLKLDLLVINGRLKDDSITIRLHRYDEKKFRLTSRGFHWVNEYPFNR